MLVEGDDVANTHARVRVVVLNFNGGVLTLKCLRHLRNLDWPVGQLEIVCVDNVSTDGSIEAIRGEFPEVEIRQTSSNLGFPANNLAMRDLQGIDYVALVNNDAYVEPTWLSALVEMMESAPELGAVSSKLLLAPKFTDVVVDAPGFDPGQGDTRELGVMLRGVLVDGSDVWSHAHVGEGGWGREADRLGTFEWIGPHGVVRVPFEPGTTPQKVTLIFDSPVPTTVTVDGGRGQKSAAVESGFSPVTVELSLKPYDVVNNVGSIVFDDGAGADRGWLARDDGSFDEPEDVFAWCGGSVLLRPSYLADVGLLDTRFFLYYEDTDLSWRGRARGWRYCTAPKSVARHEHAASSGEGSEVFAYHVERNRLLMLVKNAPAGMAAKQVWHFVLTTLSYARRDIIRPVMRLKRPRLTIVRRRLRSFLGFLALLPAMLVTRRRLRSTQLVPDAELAEWFVKR
ncbi:Glycosyltransferase 2-like [Acidimicrobiia bacterium]